MSNQPKEILEQIIKELLSVIDFESQVNIDDAQAELLVVRIESEEAGLLIGQGGANLAALQHLARAIINKKFGLDSPRFIIDINNYRIYRQELLKEIALNWARRVVEERQTMILEPMSAYERRIIHVVLSNFSGIKTESQGEEPARRIIIRPDSEIQ